MPRPNVLRQRAAVVAIAGLLLGLAAGCSGSSGPTPTPSSSPAPTGSATPTPTPTPAAAAALGGLAGKGLAADWTATYSLDPTDAAEPDSTVTLFRIGARYRIDIVQKNATTLFMTTDQGYVSCRVEGNQRTCLLVGPLDKPVPEVFDPGLQRIVTVNLQALADGGPALKVARTGVLAEVEGLPGAECFEVSGPGVDAGEYCLTAAGVPRRVTYPTGTLSMTAVAGAPNPQVLTPPVSPTPVPSSR